MQIPLIIFMEKTTYSFLFLVVLTVTLGGTSLCVAETTAELTTKGIALYDDGHYDEALDLFEQVLETESDFAYAWYNKGNALYHLKEYKEAIEAYKKALEIDPEYSYADYAWYNIGNSYLELKETEKAIEAYEKAIDYLYSTEEWIKAIEIADKVIEFAPPKNIFGQ